MRACEGKVALVTGAGSGMGRATAIMFAQRGARVAVSDYAAGTAEETVRMIREAGGEAIAIPTDVRVAELVTWLCSDVASYVSGGNIMITAGVNL